MGAARYRDELIPGASGSGSFGSSMKCMTSVLSSVLSELHTEKMSTKTFSERLGKSAHTRIVNFLSALSSAPYPREKRAALTGQFSGYWCYHVGDYRLICELRDGELVVLVLKIGHRREVYR